MLLSLAFGGQGLGRAGSSIAWQNSRTDVSDLRVVLLPQSVPVAEPLLSTDIEQALQPNTAEPTTKTLAQVVLSTQISAAAPSSTFQISPLQSERPNKKTAPLAQPAEDLIALTKPNKSTWAVRPAPEVP
ncbi:MAG: hypothetical protein H7252_08925, partial [Cytophaga sp.]|nr:hypothetical protein [Undibacterium sp.]